MRNWWVTVTIRLSLQLESFKCIYLLICRATKGLKQGTAAIQLDLKSFHCKGIIQFKIFTEAHSFAQIMHF